MNGRERMKAILNHESDHCGFWHGDPNPTSIGTLYPAFGVKDDFELGLKLGSSCRWLMAERYDCYRHPEGKPFFDPHKGIKKTSLSHPGIFADCEDPDEIHAADWPDPQYLDFTDTIAAIDETIAAGQAVLSGSWSCFFHVLCDYFGMENYFAKMITDPEVVDAATEHVLDYYLKANEKLFQQAGDKIDLFFFGNDFGTQLDTLISPKLFDRFVMPGFTQFTNLAHKYGIKVLLHSCGSIHRVIPRMIDAGVDALHPIQARAANMDAETLARDFGDKIVFVGGVDTQYLLPHATPAQIKDEVRRLRDLFGPNYVVSPSHESILPDVPWQNIQAMAEAAAE